MCNMDVCVSQSTILTALIWPLCDSCALFAHYLIEARGISLLEAFALIF